MDFIFENIYLLVLAAAGIAQWWKSTQEAKKERENNAPPREVAPPPVYQPYKENFPSPVIPPPLPNKSGSPAPSLVSMRRAQEELARQEAMNEKLKEAKRAKQKKKSQEKTQEVYSQTVVAKSSKSIRSALSNRHEIRRAFILKEILEKPVGLR
jgi:type IV secretory pathway VirB10-like protein